MNKITWIACIYSSFNVLFHYFFILQESNPFSLDSIQVGKIIQYKNVSVKVEYSENKMFTTKHKLIVMSNEGTVSVLN